MRIAFIGPTYPLDSKPASVQRTVNMYPVKVDPDNERSPWVFKDLPGLVEVDAFGAPAIGNWLGYNDGGYGPTMMDEAGAYQALGSPVTFSDGVTFSQSSFTNTDGVAHVPFSGGLAEAPTLVEGVTWFPENGGDPAPTISTTNPSGGVWTGYSWVMRSPHSGQALLQGPEGDLTVVTFNTTGSPSFYEGASLEYFTAPVGPDSTLAALPYTDSFSMTAGQVKWYRFTVGEGVSVTMDTIGSSVDTQIALYSSIGAMLQEDDESGGSSTSLITRTLPAGTYYLAVSGYSSSFAFGFNAQSFSSETGSVSVSIQETPA